MAITQEINVYRLITIISVFLLFFILVYIRKQVFILAKSMNLTGNNLSHKAENRYKYRIFWVLLCISCGIFVSWIFPDGIYAFIVIILEINIAIKLRFIIQRQTGMTKPETEWKSRSGG